MESQNVHPGHPEGTASDTLDRIRAGGAQLIVAAHRRLGDVKTQLDEGNFKGAMGAAAQLHEKISALAEAESAMGAVAEACILKCREITVGMALVELGEVTAIEPCPCGQAQCDRIVLTVGDQPVNLVANAELIVVAGT